MTQREITSHIVHGAAGDTLTLVATDEPGAGGAQHRYVISGFDAGENPSVDYVDSKDDPRTNLVVLFQNGPIGEVGGLNGVTGEVLLAIVKDRLEAFQRGPYACDDNAVALAAVDNAMYALQTRTRNRIARGVEGTHKV